MSNFLKIFQNLNKNPLINSLELSDTFDLLDLDKDGRLSRNEIAALLRSSAKIEPTRKELDFLFSEMDHESNFILNFLSIFSL